MPLCHCVKTPSLGSGNRVLWHRKRAASGSFTHGFQTKKGSRRFFYRRINREKRQPWVLLPTDFKRKGSRRFFYRWIKKEKGSRGFFYPRISNEKGSRQFFYHRVKRKKGIRGFFYPRISNEKGSRRSFTGGS